MNTIDKYIKEFKKLYRYLKENKLLTRFSINIYGISKYTLDDCVTREFRENYEDNGCNPISHIISMVCNHYGVSKSLQSAFVWDNSNEGGNFWRKIYFNYDCI